MKKIIVLLIAILCIQLVYASCDREDWFCGDSDYSLGISSSRGSWDFFLWDPERENAGDPTKYDMGWYPLQDWEYAACVTDFSPELKASSASLDLSGQSKVYDITIQASARRKNITTLSQTLTFETQTNYEYEWYVQPPYGDVTFQVFKINSDGTEEPVTEATNANYMTGSAGYFQEYSSKLYINLTIKYNGNSFSTPVRIVS
jgi:hypothetical protein